jgi:hypothetical protein
MYFKKSILAFNFNDEVEGVDDEFENGLHQKKSIKQA